MSSDDMVLVPLDADIIHARLFADDFTLERTVDGSARQLHFGREFPGVEALELYHRLLGQAGEHGIVDGTYVVVEGNEVIGQVGTLGPPAGGAVEVGYGINPSAQGRGVATRALGALLERLDVGRVRLCTAVSNPASGRVAEKTGFTVVDTVDDDFDGKILIWSMSL